MKPINMFRDLRVFLLCPIFLVGVLFVLLVVLYYVFRKIPEVLGAGQEVLCFGTRKERKSTFLFCDILWIS
jgi:hypothetical protein